MLYHYHLFLNDLSSVSNLGPCGLFLLGEETGVESVETFILQTLKMPVSLNTRGTKLLCP